jgi:molybdopterin converting factor small subunit
VKVLFYGRLAESIAPEIEVDALAGTSVAELRDRLIALYPEAERTLSSRRSRACIGDTLVNDNYMLKAADTVEFLSPVSGG